MQILKMILFLKQIIIQNIILNFINQTTQLQIRRAIMVEIVVIFNPDKSPEIISEGYETSPFKKNQSMKSLASQTMSISSMTKSRIRRYGKNKNERETALR